MDIEYNINNSRAKTNLQKVILTTILGTVP